MATTTDENTPPAAAVATAAVGNHADTFLHKTVSQTSKNKNNWVSPFRPASASSSPRKVVTSAVKPVAEPEKSKEEPEEEPEEEPLAAEEDAAAPVDDAEEPIVDESEEPLEEPIVDESEEPVEEPLEEPVEEPVEEPLEEPLEEPAVPATSKKSVSAPIKPAVLEIPENIKQHPKMLRRYKENFNIASQIMNKNKIENIDRRVNLGAGLILTEEQIYELARKKLQPLMKQIDEKVAENNARDAEKAAKIEADIKAKDEAVVAGMLSTYKVGVDAKTKTATDEHDAKFKALEDKSEKSKADFEKYIQDEKDGIVKDKEDAEKAEEDAKNDHVTNKETLIANHEQKKEDKSNELESFKTKQVEESDLIEKFTNDTESQKERQVELQKTLDAKKAELEEKIKKVEALIAAKHEKKETIRSSIKRKKVADRSFGIINSKHAQAAANVALLSTQVGLLGDRVNAHSTKIEHFNTTAKDALVNKKVEAEKATQDWEAHLAQVRLEEAQKQEQIRIAAEEERKRIEQEKAEEEERIAKEKEEEEARIAKEKEEEEAKIAQQKEKERLAAEKKKQEEEEEAERTAAELERLKELKRLNAEKIQMQKEIDEQNKKLAEAERKASETKSHSSGFPGGAILGAAAGALTGAAAVGATAAGVAASGAANATSNIAGASGHALHAAASSTPSDLPQMKSLDPAKGAQAQNPFYVGDFNDQKDDLPSIIHEEEEPHHAEAPHESTIPEEIPLEKGDDFEDDVSLAKDESKDDGKEADTPVADVATPTTESKDDDDLTAAVDPANRRRSMVDEALAHMTPEQIAKMNTPLSQQIKKQPSKTSIKESNVQPVAGGSKSRSNSLTSKFSLRRTKSKTGNSRNNSLKGDNPRPRPSASRTNSVKGEASNRTPVNEKNAKPVLPEPVKTPAAPVAASAAATAVSAPVAVSDSVASLAPSGISQAEVSEAKAVHIKNAGAGHNGDLATLQNSKSQGSENAETITPQTAGVQHSNKNNENDDGEDDDSELDLDSDLDRPNVNPVFTEKIGAAEETAPTTAHSQGEAPADDNSQFVEVSTLETVSSSEYRQHKDDPNYMIVQG